VAMYTVAENEARRSVSLSRCLSLVAAGAMAAAGMIHLRFAPAHMEEDWLHGAAFYIMAGGQLLLVPYLLARTVSRSAARAGAVANLAIVAVWFLSRTVGVPGSHGWEAREALGLADLVCVGLQLLTAGTLSLLASDKPAAQRVRDHSLSPVGAILLVVMAASALIPVTRAAATSEHGHSEECPSMEMRICSADSHAVG
jgi:hypothetical protein